MDTNLTPVTILVATFNRARYIGLAIESARKQTYTNWEMIVLDDAGTDDTESIVRKIAEKDQRIKYIRHDKNKGIADNRNTGLELAQGTYVAILDSDDIWTDPTKLEKQISYLLAHHDCVAIGTQISIIDENGKQTGSISYETTDKKIRAQFLKRNQFAQSSLVYKLSTARSVNGYDNTYKVIDDYDLWLKIGTKGTFANLPDQMTAYREHSGGITKTRQLKSATEHLAIIKKHGKQYPNYFSALLKAYLRILKAL